MYLRELGLEMTEKYNILVDTQIKTMRISNIWVLIYYYVLDNHNNFFSSKEYSMYKIMRVENK